MASVSYVKDEWAEFMDKTAKGGKTGETKGYVACYKSHPPLPLGEGLVIYGGSCGTPVVADADVYVGLDHSMAETPRRFPWSKGTEFRYLIADMAAPTNAATFKQLIDWLEDQIRAGAKVHVGCIGGHGRTGTVFAALAAQMLKVEDPIGYVRKHYCKKAVESQAQIDFLVKHYGAKPVQPTKTFTTTAVGKVSSFGGSSGFGKIHAVKSDLCIFGKNALVTT